MNSSKLTIKDSSLSFFVGFLLCQIGVVIISFIAAIVCSIFKINTDNFSLFLNTALGYLICSLGMDIAILIVFFFFNNKKGNKLISKPSILKILFYVFIAILFYLCLYPIINCIDSLFVKLGIEQNTIPYELNTANYFISLFSLVLLPAVCEELLFRGLIFKGLNPYGKIFSTLLTALMFAIFHMSIDQFVYPLIMGLLLSLIMHKENNIIYCIVVHFINNFISLTLSYFRINLIFQHWTYILLAIILFIIIITILILLLTHRDKNQEKNKLNKTDKLYLIICLSVMLILWTIINIDKIL